MDVAGRLRSLGLGCYEQAFRDNEIDAEVLASLTAEDLKDLGVAVVGHRRKLVDAIAALRTASASWEGPAGPGTPSSAQTERGGPEVTTRV